MSARLAQHPSPEDLPLGPAIDLESRPKSLNAWGSVTCPHVVLYGGIHFGCASRIKDPEAVLPVGNGMRLKLFAVIGFVSAGLMACEQPAPPTPQIRSVRAVTVERRVISEPVVLIGQIRARNEISLAFRIDGKLIERSVAVGDRITVGRLVARLDSQDEKNALQGAVSRSTNGARR